MSSTHWRSMPARSAMKVLHMRRPMGPIALTNKAPDNGRPCAIPLVTRPSSCTPARTESIHRAARQGATPANETDGSEVCALHSHLPCRPRRPKSLLTRSMQDFDLPIPCTMPSMAWSKPVNLLSPICHGKPKGCPSNSTDFSWPPLPLERMPSPSKRSPRPQLSRLAVDIEQVLELPARLLRRTCGSYASARAPQAARSPSRSPCTTHVKLLFLQLAGGREVRRYCTWTRGKRCSGRSHLC